MATFTKPPFFMKVVWKLFQFKKIIVCEPGLRFFETFSESGGLPWQMTYFCCFALMATSTFYAILPQKEIYNFDHWFKCGH